MRDRRAVEDDRLAPQIEQILLIAALRQASLKMPPDEKPPAEVIADYVKWS